jgi:hypothetical protein
MIMWNKSRVIIGVCDREDDVGNVNMRRGR